MSLPIHAPHLGMELTPEREQVGQTRLQRLAMRTRLQDAPTMHG